jgi:uncharacterized protein
MFSKFYRIFKKYYFKLLRSNGSPHSLAMAVALGFFVACFIPTGGHTVIVLLLAFLFKTDKILAFAATWITNPYTIPFMYPVFCFVGSKILGTDLSFKVIDKEIVHVIHDFSWHNLLQLGEELVFSFLVGGFIFGIILGGIGYFITYRMVVLYRNKKSKKIEKVN